MFRLIAILLLVPFCVPAYALTTVISQTFKTATATGWIRGNSAVLTSGNGDPTGNGWLRLTSNSGNQKGYAYYNTAFNTSQGFVVEFEYASWGGTGADGFTVFLFDGATTSFNIGDFGGSLGYANGCSGTNGLSRAYVGVAFDEFGNFSNPSDRCKNGGPGAAPETVAIRGAGNGSGTGQYSYLTGATSPASIDCPSSSCTARPSGTNYRKVRITMLPSGGTYSIKVEVQYGSTAAYTTVIPTYTLPTPIYSTLKIGFAASTGGSTNYHEVRNLTLSVLDPVDLAITKSATPAAPTSLYVGDNITYTLGIKNNGPSTATAVVVSDNLPSSLTYVSATPSTGSCSYTSPTITCNLGNMANAATASIAIIATTGYAGAASATVTNTASVSTSDYDNTSSNNAASVSSTVLVGSPTMNVTKVADKVSAAPGDLITYTVTVNNTGAARSKTITISDALSQFTAFDLTFNSSQRFEFLADTSGLTMGTPAYSQDGTNYTYTPASGGGSQPAGYDGNVRSFKIDFSNLMKPASSFRLRYRVRVK